MKALTRALTAALKPPGRRGNPDPHCRARQRAKCLAVEHSIELEPCAPGINVWPPRGLSVDPFEGDHYASDWSEALAMVEAYAAACPAPGIDPGDGAAT